MVLDRKVKGEVLRRAQNVTRGEVAFVQTHQVQGWRFRVEGSEGFMVGRVQGRNLKEGNSEWFQREISMLDVQGWKFTPVKFSRWVWKFTSWRVQVLDWRGLGSGQPARQPQAGSGGGWTHVVERIAVGD